MRIGEPVVAWYGDEIGRLRQLQVATGNPGGLLAWDSLQNLLD
jgi:hypothetical protein